MRTPRPVRIINVPLDLGASRRGTAGGPCALRAAGLSTALESLGYPLRAELDISVPVFDTRGSVDQTVRFKAEILAVCECRPGTPWKRYEPARHRWCLAAIIR